MSLDQISHRIPTSSRIDTKLDMFLSSDGSTSIVPDLTVIHSDAYSGYGELYKDPAREVTEVAC
jgi:hypothetical protein